MCTPFGSAAFGIVAPWDLPTDNFFLELLDNTDSVVPADAAGAACSIRCHYCLPFAFEDSEVHRVLMNVS